MLGLSRGCRAVLLFSALMVVVGSAVAQTSVRRHHVLVVGWHDEFQTLDNWAPWTASGGVDILRGAVGKLTVVVGKTAIRDANFNNYRAGVYQDFDVDLVHYPILAVRATQLHNVASWDAQVGEYRDEAAPEAHNPSHGGSILRPGNPQQLVSDLAGQCQGQHKPGLVLIPLTPTPYGNKGKQHVRLLLNVNGPGHDGYVDFAWVRFIRREDAARLRQHRNGWQVQLARE